MGAIRKTTSVLTLGVVPFRSRKERLARVEVESRTAATELEREREARLRAEERLDAANKRVETAEGTLLKEARALRRRSTAMSPFGRRRRRKAGRLSAVIDGAMDKVEPRVESSMEHLGERTRDVTDAARSGSHRLRKDVKKTSRSARKDAKKAAKAIRKDAEKTAESAKRQGKKAAKKAEKELGELAEDGSKRSRRAARKARKEAVKASKGGRRHAKKAAKKAGKQADKAGKEASSVVEDLVDALPGG